MRFFFCRFLQNAVKLIFSAQAAVHRRPIWIFQKIQIGGNELWLTTKPKKNENGGSGKEAEEKKMRSMGVSEDTIEKLYTHDWAIFNSDRRYYEKLQNAGTYLEEVAEDKAQPEVKTVEDFLDSIENHGLYQVLIKTDKLTLQAVLLQFQGFSVSEIARMLGMKEDAVYKRLQRLREKIKKFWDSVRNHTFSSATG